MSSSIATVHTNLSAWLLAQGDTLVPAFGEAELKTHTDDFRKLVIAPGGPAPTRELGKLRSPERIGGDWTTRPVASLDELFRVFVSAYDKDHPDDTKSQYVATRDLFDLVFTGLVESYRAFQPVTALWVVGSTMAPFGAAIMIVATVRDEIRGPSVEEAGVNVAPRKPAIRTTVGGASDEDEE